MKKIKLLVLIALTISNVKAENLESFNKLGDANWTETKKNISAETGTGFLVSKESYKNFELSLDFFAGTGTNSCVFFRCDEPTNISDKSCYEANIFDTRPDQLYRTGGLVNFSAPRVKVITEDGKWHHFKISAKGDQVKIVLDSKTLVNINDKLHSSGPIALQFVQGQIKFRNIKIKKLK